MPEEKKNYDEIFDKYIISKPGDPYKDITPLLSDPKAFKAAVDAMVEKLGPLDPSIKKIVCPSQDTTFASALAYTLGLGVCVLNPYDGFVTSGEYFQPGEGVLVVGSALCGGSIYFSMYSLIEDMGAKVMGFAFLLEKLEHRGRSKLLDSVFTPIPMGIVTVVKFGVTIGNFVRFDCSAHGLGIREFRVLRVMPDEIGINWLDGPVPCEKVFPKTRIIEVSQDKVHWYKYRP